MQKDHERMHSKGCMTQPTAGSAGAERQLCSSNVSVIEGPASTLGGANLMSVQQTASMPGGEEVT